MLTEDIKLQNEIAKIDHPSKAGEIWEQLADLTVEGEQYAEQKNYKALEHSIYRFRDTMMQLANAVTDPIEKDTVENLLIPLITMLSISAGHHVLEPTEIRSYIVAKDFALKHIIAAKKPKV